MTSKPDTWMPLYIGDYLADTMHLGAAEHGAYLLLLMHSWRNGPLPADDKALAAIARADSNTWRKIGATVKSFFTSTENGLVQNRLEEEREEAHHHAEKRRERATKAAASRWAGDAQSNATSTATSNASGMPTAMLEECPLPSPSPLSTPSPIGEGDATGKPAAPPQLPLGDNPPAAPIRRVGRGSADEQVLFGMVKTWNELASANGLPQVSKLSTARQVKLRARIKASWADDPPRLFREHVERICASKFCRGEIDRSDWVADFDWAIRSEQIVLSVAEGKYDDKENHHGA